MVNDKSKQNVFRVLVFWGNGSSLLIDAFVDLVSLVQEALIVDLSSAGVVVASGGRKAITTHIFWCKSDARLLGL